MDKVRLKNGTEFDLIPMGIDTKGNLRILKIITDMPHDDIVTEFTNPDNIAKIDHFLGDGTIGATYEYCVSFKSLTFIPSVQIDDNTVSDIWVALLSTDAVERKLETLNAEMVNIVNAVVTLSIMTL